MLATLSLKENLFMQHLLTKNSSPSALLPPGEYQSTGGGNVHLLRAWPHEEPARGNVVFESALGCPATEWTFLQLHLAEKGYASVAYDRPGVGWTAPTWRPRTVPRHCRDLDRLLGRLQVKAGTILVGHSIGGLLAAHFAARNARHIKGLVLIDSSHPEMTRRSPRQQDAIRTLRNQLRLAQRRRLDLTQRTNRNLPWPEYFTETQGNSPSGIKGMLAELRAWDSQWQRWPTNARALKRMPLLVITAGESIGQDPSHMELQEELRLLSGRSQHVVIDKATHRGVVMNFDEPRKVAREITDFFGHLIT